jgi:hypothetical protein
MSVQLPDLEIPRSSLSWVSQFPLQLPLLIFQTSIAAPTTLLSFPGAPLPLPQKGASSQFQNFLKLPFPASRKRPKSSQLPDATPQGLEANDDNSPPRQPFPGETSPATWTGAKKLTVSLETKDSPQKLPLSLRNLRPELQPRFQHFPFKATTFPEQPPAGAPAKASRQGKAAPASWGQEAHVSRGSNDFPSKLPLSLRNLRPKLQPRFQRFPFKTNTFPAQPPAGAPASRQGSPSQLGPRSSHYPGFQRFPLQSCHFPCATSGRSSSHQSNDFPSKLPISLRNLRPEPKLRPGSQ